VKKEQSQWYAERGFSLIEVLVAMVLFSVAFLGFAKLQVGTIKANGTAARRTFAATFAQQAIERIRNGGACNTTPATQGSITYSVACTMVAGPNNTQNVTVTVTWSDPTTQTVTLQTRT
jgi:prepilin-type N-terminal cleavage/methylation domain-containing protein